LKASSEDFIFYMEKRGNNYDETLKKNLYLLENDHKPNEIKRNELYTQVLGEVASGWPWLGGQAIARRHSVEQ